MLIDKQETRVMKEKEDNKKIFEAICKFYKFRMSHFLNSKLISRNMFFLKITDNNSFTDSCVLLSKEIDQRVHKIQLFASKHDAVKKILNWAETFEICDFLNNPVHVKNIFLGCKTLEDVLIVKDLHSVEEITL